MAKFVLIHGACHRSGVWRAVMPALAARGHSAQAVSLQGATLNDHAAGIVAQSPKGAILVGHSAGGFVAHAAALAAPQIFGGIIYLCAFIPTGDWTVADLRRAAPQDALGPAIRRNATTYEFDPDAAERLFFNGCPDPTAHVAGLRADPIVPVQTALLALPAAFARAAIICDDDRAISPAYQMHMAAGIALRRHLPCGHAPFFAAPDLLAQSLHDLADIIGRR